MWFLINFILHGKLIRRAKLRVSIGTRKGIVHGLCESLVANRYIFTQSSLFDTFMDRLGVPGRKVNDIFTCNTSSYMCAR